MQARGKRLGVFEGFGKILSSWINFGKKCLIWAILLAVHLKRHYTIFVLICLDF
jgi:hypothetical protein